MYTRLEYVADICIQVKTCQYVILFSFNIFFNNICCNILTSQLVMDSHSTECLVSNDLFVFYFQLRPILAHIQ